MFQINICSGILSLGVFPSRRAVLQGLLCQHPFYCSGKVRLTSEERNLHLSLLTLLSGKWRVMQKQDFSFLTSVLLLRHFRADVSYDLSIPRSKTVAFSPLPPVFLKCHRLLLQPYQKSQERHSLRVDWWCFESHGLKNVYPVLFWCMYKKPIMFLRCRRIYLVTNL